MLVAQNRQVSEVEAEEEAGEGAAETLNLRGVKRGEGVRSRSRGRGQDDR